MKVNFIIILTAIFLSMNSEGYSQRSEEKPTYIKFYAQVNYISSVELMTVIDGKMKEGRKKFIILISSPGGEVTSGISIYNYLKGIPAEVITHNFGSIDSMAVVLYCAGSKRLAVPNAKFFLHDIGLSVSSSVRWEQKQLDEKIKQLTTERNIIAEIISINSNKDKENIANAILNTTVLSSDEAKKWGLVHEIKEDLFEEDAEVITITDISIKKRLKELNKK